MSYEAFRQRLVDAVLTTPGATPGALRRAVLVREKVPAPLAPYVDNVYLRAYKVTDADLAGLARAGYSEDAVFELTVAAAVGAALKRLDRGMAALRGQEPD